MISFFKEMWYKLFPSIEDDFVAPYRDDPWRGATLELAAYIQSLHEFISDQADWNYKMIELVDEGTTKPRDQLLQNKINKLLKEKPLFPSYPPKEQNEQD